MNGSEITETTRWVIATDKSNFDELRTDEGFWSIVALARSVNTLFFVHQALVPHEGDASPAASRARYNSVLFSCAILAESLLLVRRIGKHFAPLPEFRRLSELVNGKAARKIIESAFFGLRNKLVFHFDPDEIGEQLRDLDLPSPIFLSAMGRTNGQTYYELADLCAFRTLYGPSFPTADAALAETEFTKISSNLIIDFSNLAQEVIVAYLSSKGWYKDVLSDASKTPMLEWSTNPVTAAQTSKNGI
jgi:hypothetical protein